MIHVVEVKPPPSKKYTAGLKQDFYSTSTALIGEDAADFNLMHTSFVTYPTPWDVITLRRRDPNDSWPWYKLAHTFHKLFVHEDYYTWLNVSPAVSSYSPLTKNTLTWMPSEKHMMFPDDIPIKLHSQMSKVMTILKQFDYDQCVKSMLINSDLTNNGYTANAQIFSLTFFLW